MSESESLLKRAGRFIDEVVLEMKKSSWPDRKSLVSHTLVVIVSVLMLGIFIGVSDKALAMLLRWLVPQG